MKCNRTRISGLVAGALLVVSGSAAASGFALIEQSGSGLGNAYAGGAASAEDASTVFFNPAGMSQIKGRQVVVALHAIKPSAKFSDTGSSAAAGQALGGNGGDAGSLAFVPNLYYVMDVNQNIKFGLGINAPFGLKTEYDAGWAGRFQAMKSEVKTVNVNPTLSYQMNETVTLGLGVDYQKIDAELTNKQSLGAGVEGNAKVSGSDNAWGYNLGALFQVNPDTRVGVAYRSSINYNLSGDLLVTSPAGTVLANPSVTADIKTPDSLSVSGFRKIDAKWDVMGDITWTGWSKFKELRVVDSTGTTRSLTNENWKDTYRFSIGANHHYNEQWISRIGIAFDQGPVKDQYRTARIPDNDRTWIAFGGKYTASNNSSVDVGYAHLFVKDSSISNDKGGATGTSTPGTVGNLVGTYKNSVDILSVQYTYSF